MTRKTAEDWIDEPELVSIRTARRWIEDDHGAFYTAFAHDTAGQAVPQVGGPALIRSEVIFKWRGY